MNDQLQRSPAKRRKVILIAPGKRPLNSRKQKISTPIPSRYRNGGFKRPIRVKSKRPVPRVSPEQRLKDLEDSDPDILDIPEDSFIESNKSDRGKLLRLSTLKPRAESPKRSIEVDTIPEGSIDATKRIVRIVDRSDRQKSLNIQVQQTHKEAAVQVGIPLGEYLKRKRQSAPQIATPGPEVPLQGYWTHKINLPYPQQANQPQFVAPQQQQQQQQPFVQTPDGNWVPYNQPQVVYLPQAPAPAAQFVNRSQRRNFYKSQKHHQRFMARQN